MPRSKPGALPLGDALNSMIYMMAGAAGFEPTDAEIKTRCLPLATPNISSLQVRLAGAAGFEPTDAEIKTGALPLGDANV